MKKIMFNDRYGLTKAVLEGRKTMTRRIVNFDRVPTLIPGRIAECCLKYAPFKPGEVVAVAQKYKDIPNPFRGRVTDYTDAAGWENKMFVKAELMPYKIRITNVRVEWLQDISEEDCLREGVFEQDHCFFVSGIKVQRDHSKHYGGLQPYSTARDAFSLLIDKVSGKGTWVSNPWVFVYEFELVKD